ncbi:extracellular solute-binding protein [Streptomyces sp. NPDC051217]|uniref:extracellular solute-binding protein n=1 Tax=Streptomyces sp. NPDC051217 TaxID=3365644 RepID=UPI0037B4D467
MRAPYRLFRTVLAGALFAGAALLSAGCAAEEEPTLVVLGPWTDGEEKPFKTTLAKIGERTGRHYVYKGTRSLRETLVAQLRTDAPPDVAILNGPGELAEYARNGDAQPLEGDVEDKAIAPWAPRLSFTTAKGTEAHAYWVPIRVDLKSIVWSRAGETDAGPEEAVWCLGMASGATSGWPGTDWIEDLLLQRQGHGVYEDFATGQLPWDGKAVRQAWLDWATVLATDDLTNRSNSLTKDFEKLGTGRYGLLKGKDCTREHQGSFIGRHYGDDVRPAPTSEFVEWLPKDRNVFEVSGDMAAVFKPSPAAWELMLELTSPRTQADWVEAAGPGERPYFPSGKTVTAVTTGKNAPTGASADVLRMFNNADQICVDASDAMPSTLRGAFQRAVLEFLEKPDDTAALDDLLAQLEAERLLQRTPKAFALDDVCGAPPG